VTGATGAVAHRIEERSRILVLHGWNHGRPDWVVVERWLARNGVVISFSGYANGVALGRVGGEITNLRGQQSGSSPYRSGGLTSAADRGEG